VYRSVAQLETPLLDEPMRRVSAFANFSKPWMLVAGVLAVVGGSSGRRAALTGLAAVGTTSLVVNQPLKRAGERRRPDRVGLGVPEDRWVRMPSSTSFPSGHSASAAAFAVAVGDVLPPLRVPLRVAASVVAFSRVYTGVHYPSDVVVGATAGALLGRLVSRRARRPAQPA
jgi:undecaprenyl-diphosphatase